MEIAGYTWRPAELAFRTADHPELAITPEQSSMLDVEGLVTSTERWIDEWSSSAASLLQGELARLVSVSAEQLTVLSKLLEDAGLEPLSELSEPPPEFVWGPAAGGGVMALMDVAVDIGDRSLETHQWAEEALVSLDTGRFERVTGIVADDQAVVLRCCERAILDSQSRGSTNDLLYRDRHVRIQWTDGAVQVSQVGHISQESMRLQAKEEVAVPLREAL